MCVCGGGVEGLTTSQVQWESDEPTRKFPHTLLMILENGAVIVAQVD